MMSRRIILSTGRRLGKKITATGTSKQVREGGYPFRIPTWLPTLGRRWVAIVGPRSEFQIYFFAFFAFFRFKFFTSLRFSNFCFEAKRNSSLFFPFFSFFSLFLWFFRLFFTFFRLIFVSLRFFHLIFAYFTFVFASDFWCFASKWIMWNQAFFCFQAKRNFRFNFKFRFRSESEGAP